MSRPKATHEIRVRRGDGKWLTAHMEIDLDKLALELARRAAERGGKTTSYGAITVELKERV